MNKLLILLIFLPFEITGQVRMTPDKWSEDLTYLQEKLEERHANLYHTISKEGFNSEIEMLSRLSKSIDDREVIIRISEMIAKIGDAHTWLHPGYQEHWEFKRLPLKFTYFQDGLFVKEAGEEFKYLIGSRLTEINSTPFDSLKSMISQVGYNENEFTKLISLESFIVYPAVLKRFGIIDDQSEIDMVFSFQSNKKHISLTPMLSANIKWVKHTQGKEDLPLSYRGNDKIYWTTYDSKDDLIYVQLNKIEEDKDHTFTQLSKEIINRTELHKPNKLVIDLRRNVGGNSKLVNPLIYALMDYQSKVINGQIFVIIGRWTLSASIVLCAEINKYCNPVFVGEPTGAKPNLY
jgi:hypothetical protein